MRVTKEYLENQLKNTKELQKILSSMDHKTDFFVKVKDYISYKKHLLQYHIGEEKYEVDHIG